MMKSGHFSRNLKLTKKYEVNITQHAQEDLEHIFYYIAADSFVNVSRFIVVLEEKVYSLEHLPKRNPLMILLIYYLFRIEMSICSIVCAGSCQYVVV